MIIIFLITYVTRACTYTLKANKVIGQIDGAFDVSFTTPASTSYAQLTSTTNWDNDPGVQIQSGTFACSVNSNSCTAITGGVKCSSLAAGVTYTISCTGMNTPSYTGNTFGQFTVTFYDSSNADLGQGCTGGSLSDFSTGTIVLSTLTPIALTLNTAYSITFQFKLGTTLIKANNDLISIKGSGFTLLVDEGTTDFALSSSTATELIYSVSASRTQVASNIVFTIYFKGTAGTSKIAHTILVQSYKSISTQVKDILPLQTFTVTGGAITFPPSISVPNKIKNTKIYYTIPIKLTNPISASSGYITFPQPSNLAIDTTQICSISVGATIATGTTCTIDSNNLIKISGLTGLSIIAGTALTLKIAFQNPSSATSITFGTFISYYDNGQQVDASSTTSTVSGFNAGILGTVTLTSGSPKVGDIGSVSYTFTNINQILTGSTIKLKFPSEIVWQSSVNQCILSINSVSTTINGCTLAIDNLDTQAAILSNIFSSDILESRDVILTINLAIRNPYSFRPTTANGFSLSIFDSNGLPYDSKVNFGQLTMNTQSAIYINSCNRGSSVNGVSTTYTLVFQFDTQQPSGTLLVISFPSQNFGSASSTFDGTSTAIGIDSINHKITVTLPLVPAATAKSLILTNIQNLDSKVSSTLTAATFDGTYSISTTSLGSTYSLTNTDANQITVNSMTQDNYLLGELDSYSFELKLSNILSTGATLIVNVPSGLTLVSTDCKTYMENVNGFTVSTCSASGQIITITPSIYTTSNTIQFKFTLLFRNPKAPSIISFSIQTYRGLYIMDQTQSTDSLKFSTLCDLPCRTCVDTRPKCTTCYSDTITTSIYYFQNYCYDQCNTGYYPDSNNKCQACSTHCIKCTAATCTECDSNLYEIKNAKCSLICLENQFDYNGICTDCNSNCNRCSGSSTTCLSCKGTDMLYSSKCVTECPTGVYQVGLTCVGCQFPCKTCGTGPSVCATCQDNYYFKKASTTCVTDCGSNYYKNGSECTSCIQPCNNCSSDQQCIDCMAGYFFLNNQCIQYVPNGYYKSGTQLAKCADECGNCSSQTECTSCPTSKFLLSSKCIDKCPDNNYSVNFVCMACDTSCLQCTSSVVCTKCPDGQFQLSGKCLTICPDKYYGSNLQCLSCASTCKTCLNGTECDTCPTTNTPYLLNKVCAASCPVNYYIDKITCIQCSKECATCDSTGCLTCITNYKQLNQTCAATCPTGYQDLQNTGKCEVVTASDQTVINNLQENKYIPVPFTIVTLIMLLSVVVAKIQKSETFIPGSAVGLLGLLIIGSWAVLLLLQLEYILKKLETYLLMGALGIHFFLNLINLCVIKKCTSGDQSFLLWYSARKSNACAYILLNTISLLSFTQTRFYFSRYFGFRFLKCKLSNVDDMSGLNIINGLCTLFCCIPACISAVLLAYRDELREQLFISSIDAFIVTIIFAISLIWETQKDDSYFEDANYASVSQSHQVIPEFFQTQRSKNSKRFSFEEPSNMNLNKFNDQDEEPSFPKIDESVEYKDHQFSQPQQPVFKMQQKSSQFTFKQEIPDFFNNQKVSNRSQDEVVLEMPNNDNSEPLSIGESLREQSQAKMTLEQQQENQNRIEEEQRLTIEQEEKQKQLEKEQLRLNDQKRLEQEKQIQEELAAKELIEQQRLNELKKQEEIQRQELLLQQEEAKRKEEELRNLEQRKIQEEEQRKQLLDQEQQKQKQEEEAKKQQELLQLQEEQRKQQEQQEEQRKQEQLEQIRQKEIEQKKFEEQQSLLKQKQQEEELRQAELLKQQDIEKQQKEEQQRLEQEKRQELEKQENLRKQQEQEQEEKLRQEKLQEAEKLKQQQLEEEAKKADELEKLQEEQRQQELKEQEMMQRVKQSREQKRNAEQQEQNQDIEVMQNEIEDLKLQVEDFDDKNKKLNEIILVDEDDDDVGWDVNEDENAEEGMYAQQRNYQKEIIQDDKNDVDDDWDVPTSGFVSVQPKSQLKKDQQVEEPVNPFKGMMQKQVADSDLFKQSREDSDEDDWAANQISPSDFNALNQRLEMDKHSITQADQSKKFSRTGQNFKSGVAKRPTLPDPQANSDNESFDQQSVFDQFARNQLSNVPKKQNKGLDKIYLQRLSKKQQQKNTNSNIGIQDIEF